MPVQAIIRKSKMPESCFSCDYNVEYCYGHECGISLLRGDCPFYEIPEWTEKDHNNLALVKDCMVNDDSIMDTLEKLCLLAGVEE